MSDESSSGGRGPSSIKPPTIKPPTAQADDVVATPFPSASAPSFGAMPQSTSTPVAASSPSPRRQRNVGLWIVAGVWLFFLLIFALGVVVYLSLR
jgi:hypothetical protein